MDKKVFEYRKKHKKCKYCKHLKYELPCVNVVPAYYKCIAKDKVIQNTFPDMTNILRICSCYEVDEDK